MNARPLVVVAIATRNRSASLLALLDAVDAQRIDEPVDVSIIVWDDASSPEHRAAVRSSSHWGRPDLRIHLSDVHERMRVKRRLDEQALAVAAGRDEAYVAHFDDDVLPESGWLAVALSALRETGWSGCGSVERVQDGWVMSGEPRLDVAPRLIAGSQVGVWRYHRRYVSSEDRVGRTKVAFAGHRAVLVRADAVAAVPHDDGYAIGGEDLDWSLSLQRAGHSLGIAHGARIQHRTYGEQDDPGFRDPELVLASWRRFYARWGFVRDSAAEEAGVSRDEWLKRFADVPTDRLLAGAVVDERPA